VTVGSTTYSYTSFGNKSNRGAGFERPFPYYGKFFDAGRETIQLNNSRTDLNWPVYRYAEVLLFFAEAENEANGPTGAAFDALNQVRARAKLPALAGLTKDQFREAVRQERSWELAFESKRLFDLKRWGIFYDVMQNDLVGRIGVQPHHVWMPIPQRDVDLAPSLGQNPGY
jgi:starch-binding outer membrane protein, SusD/RagB family